MSSFERVAFDPYHFPNFTAKSLERDITFTFYGAAIYEVVMCLNLYFTVCNKAKLKSGIFQLITITVFTITIALLLSIIATWNLTQWDATMTPTENIINCIIIIFVTISKIAYYIAATLRTRALLMLFPKILYGFYILLATCIISNLVCISLNIAVTTTAVNATPENSLHLFPQHLGLLIHSFNSLMVTTIFDMVLANVLIVSFLCPIFTALEMDLFPAIKTMIKLGDVQKALLSSLTNIVAVTVANSGGSIDLSASLSLFWLHTQNSLFLRLTYFTTCKLLSRNNSIKIATIIQTVQSTDKPKDSGGLRQEIIIGTSSTV